MTDRWATFDCYGTMVDWLGGMRRTFARLWPEANADSLLDLYHQLEPAVQAGRGLAYREVMAETLATTAAMARLDLPPGEEDALGASLPGWQVFAEVPSALAELRTQGWKLAILSNTDADFLDISLRAIGVPVDLRIVASDIGSYKPGVRHWDTFFAQTRADRGRHAHVAASLFHDIEPAGRLGLRCVWINRLAEQSQLPRDAELTDLTALPDALEALIPARA
jgi:2-haloacid dehalogenase